MHYNNELNCYFVNSSSIAVAVLYNGIDMQDTIKFNFAFIVNNWSDDVVITLIKILLYGPLSAPDRQKKIKREHFLHAVMPYYRN